MITELGKYITTDSFNTNSGTRLPAGLIFEVIGFSECRGSFISPSFYAWQKVNIPARKLLHDNH